MVNRIVGSYGATTTHRAHPMTPFGVKRLEDELRPLSLILEVRGEGRLIYASMPEPVTGPLLDCIFTTGQVNPFWLTDSRITPLHQLPSDLVDLDLSISLMVVDSLRGEMAIIYSATSTRQDEEDGGGDIGGDLALGRVSRLVSIYYEAHWMEEEELSVLLDITFQWDINHLPAIPCVGLNLETEHLDGGFDKANSRSEKCLMLTRMLGPALWSSVAQKTV